MYISLFYKFEAFIYYSFLFKYLSIWNDCYYVVYPIDVLLTVSSQSIDSKWWTSSWWLRCFRGCSRSKCLQHQRYEEALEDCSRQVILTNSIPYSKIFGEYLCLYVVLCQNLSFMCPMQAKTLPIQVWSPVPRGQWDRPACSCSLCWNRHKGLQCFS